MATRTYLQALADAALAHADRYQPLGAGLCLPVAAAVSHVLAARETPDVTAVAGAYIDDAHWWVRVGPFIVDPTRPQFDDGPTVVDTRTQRRPQIGGAVPQEHWQYTPEGVFPPGWSEEHVLLEAERVLLFTGIGRTFATELLASLRSVVRGGGE